MSNFSGNVRKSERSFKPQAGGTVAGIWPERVEKANQPVLDTAATPRTDGAGERELNLSVDHPDNDGGAKYLAGKIARVYRKLVADGADLETLSTEQRLALRNRLVAAILDGGNQELNDADSAYSARGYVVQVASLLFGLEPELPNTPDFLRPHTQPSPDSERVGRFGEDYLRLKAEPTGTLLKSAGTGTGVTVYCRILHKNDALREVHGVIAEEAPDKSGEILDYASSEPYFRKWSSDAAERTASAGLPVSFGNVREQHSPRAVGKLTSIQFDALNKRIPVVAKIVDDETWRKVQAGVLTGFSIGGSYLSKWADGNYTRYTAKPAEVSIVDNPCMPGALFSMVKDTPGNPELAALRKRLNELTATIQGILARRAGVTIDTTGNTGDRFVTKDAGNGNDPKQLINKALANGVAVPFSGADPRSATERASGSGRKFQTRR